MPFLQRGGSRLHYEVHGDGPPLVFAHGVGGNHASWFYQIAALADRFRVVVFDARGFGRSTDAEGLGREGFVDDLEAVFDAADVGQAVLVGQSMGGGACLGLTCRAPHRVRALVLADTLIGVRLPDEIAGLMAEVDRRTLDLPQAERVLGPSFRRREPGLSQLYLELASFNSVNLRTLPGRQALYGLDQLAATKVPVLFIVGEEDVLYPPHAVRAAQAHVPGSRVVELPGVGHSAYFEQPEMFNRAMLDWLAECVPAGGPMKAAAAAS